jgi:hypothetical protein
MLLLSNIILLIISAVSSRREFTIFFNRVAIIILLYSGIIGYDGLYITSLDTGIGIYNGYYLSMAYSQDILSSASPARELQSPLRGTALVIHTVANYRQNSDGRATPA